MTTLFLKAQIKNAHTSDLFAVPVPVKVHVANGHVVGPYIAVRHKAPPDMSHRKAVIVHAHPAPRPSPKSYPWESASQGHLIHRMTDDELVAAMVEAVSVPRSLPYLDAMRISTKGRRDSLPAEKNAAILSAMAHAEGLAGRSAPPAPKPVIITKPAAEPDHIAQGRAKPQPAGPKTAEERREQLIVRGQARAVRGRHYATMISTSPTKEELIWRQDEVRKRLANERSEPDHLADGRKILDRYKDRLAARTARGLEGLGGSYNDERSMQLWESRLAADPAKWQPGMGVSYQVSGGAKMQTNRGFRIASIDVPGKRAVLRQVADTGLTSSGGDNDRFEDSYVYLGELERDKKYDVPVPIVSKPPGDPTAKLYDDTNSSDTDQVLAWVRKIAVGRADVINDLSISREAENRYYVSGHKAPFYYIGNVVQYLIKNRKKSAA